MRHVPSLTIACQEERPHMSMKTTLAAFCTFLIAGPAMGIATLSDPISSERPLFVFAAPGEDAPDSLAHADRILSA